MQYKVGSKLFTTFEELIAWAWSEHKIEFSYAEEMSEDLKQQACDELNKILSAPEAEEDEEEFPKQHCGNRICDDYRSCTCFS